VADTPPPRRRSSSQAPRRRPILRVGLILATAWLLVMGLWPLVFPFYIRGRALMRVRAIQKAISSPDQPAWLYPRGLSEVQRLCRDKGVPCETKTPWYELEYDPAHGRVGFKLKPGLQNREELTYVVFQRIQEVLAALVLLVVAAGLGQRMLQWIGARGLPVAERLLFGTALGLGAMALVTLGLGLVGWLTFAPFAGMLVLMGLVGAGPLVDDARELYRGWRATTTHIGLWSGLMAAAGILFVALPLLGAFGPPLDYDALEYHVGAPAEYYVNGRITRLDGNCYSNFPFNVEMLYLMSMALRGGVMAGTYLGRVINVLLGVLCALSIWTFGRRFLWAARPASVPRPVLPGRGSVQARPGKTGRGTRLGAPEHGSQADTEPTVSDKRAGGFGCLLFLSCPWFFWDLTTRHVFVTLGLALFSFLAVYATLIYLYGDRAGTGAPAGAGLPGRRGILILAGLLVGLAMGTKYTAALFVAVPLVGWVALVELRRHRVRFPAKAGRVVLFAAVALAVVSPWLLKNAVMTGNPTYPLLYGAFGGVDWNEEQDARWRWAHGPKFSRAIEDARREGRSPTKALLGAAVQKAKGFFLADDRIIVLIVLFLPFALCLRSNRRVVLWLFGYLCYVVVTWYVLTHQIERMLFPGVVVMMALAGWGYVWIERSPARWLGRLAFAGYLIYMAVLGAASYAQVGDRIFRQRGAPPLDTLDGWITERQQRTGRRQELPVEAFRFIRQQRRRGAIRFGPDAKLLLVGEAQTFYLSSNGQRDFIRNTVFDRNPLLQMVRAAGVDRTDADRRAYEALIRRLRERGVRYILANFVQIARQRRTYTFPFEGDAQRAGYPAEIDEALFRTLAGMGLLREVKTYARRPRDDGDPGAPLAYAIYEVVEPGGPP